MKSRMFRPLAVAMATVLFSTGCMMSRLVDRAFLGVTVRRPAFADRKGTGIVLLPITFAIDVATFPIQALLVVILGDNFPFTEPPDALKNIRASLDSPAFQKLGEAEKAIATAEFEQLVRDGALTAQSLLSLQEDGHWVVMEVTPEARQQLLARATQLNSPAALICER